MRLREIRHANLLRLIARYGTQRKVAELTGVAAAYISQIATGKRGMGERTARQIEEALELGHGWMDRLAEERVDTGAVRDLAVEYGRGTSGGSGLAVEEELEIDLFAKMMRDWSTAQRDAIWMAARLIIDLESGDRKSQAYQRSRARQLARWREGQRIVARRRKAKRS